MPTAGTLIWIFLATGFTVGFGHCIGMCGPLVIALSLNLKPGSRLMGHVLYNIGRIVTYGLLGAAMGIAGSFTAVASHLAGIQKAVMIATGAGVALMGALMALQGAGLACFGDSPPLGDFLSRGFGRLTRRGSVSACFPLGLLLGLLPCGPVYTALVAAARAGMTQPGFLAGATSGAALMLAFGIGTLPAVALVARLSSLGWLRGREAIVRAGGLVMVGVGIWFMIQGVHL